MTLRVLAALVLVSVSMDARAFVYNGAARCCDTVYFRVQQTPAAPDPVLRCGATVPNGWFRTLIDQAAARWNNEGTSFRLIDVGSTLVTCVPDASSGNCMTVRDGQNTISLGTACPWVDNNILAFATSWYTSSGPDAGCVIESDICFNTNRTWYSGSGTCSGSCFDVVAVATHEMGHWINAGHENDVSVLGYTPIMYQSTSACVQLPMTADDRAVLRWAYSPNGVIRLPERTATRHMHPTDPEYNSPPPREACAACFCPCHGNPECDGSDINIIDVVHAIDIAFRGASQIVDSGCPVSRTDVNCSGATDILDVTRILNVAFRGSSIGTEFCNPCS